jgi:hypothetical protein
VTRRRHPDRDRGAAAVPETVHDLTHPVGGAGPAAPSPAGNASGPAAPAGARPRSRGAIAALLGLALAVLVLPVTLAVGITAATAPATPATARVVTAADFQAEYGIRVDLVAVIAAGGLVNVRFTVLDADKAGHLLHDTAELPSLYVEGTGAVLRTSQPKAHKMRILDGASYFLMYPNSGGAIQRGTQVSLFVDPVRLQPIGAQS